MTLLGAGYLGISLSCKGKYLKQVWHFTPWSLWWAGSCQVPGIPSRCLSSNFQFSLQTWLNTHDDAKHLTECMLDCLEVRLPNWGPFFFWFQLHSALRDTGKLQSNSLPECNTNDQCHDHRSLLSSETSWEVFFVCISSGILTSELPQELSMQFWLQHFGASQDCMAKLPNTSHKSKSVAKARDPCGQR